MMSITTVRFQPHDSWFFRESRPHGSVGFSELDSQFPPPVRTLAGALRTAIGDSLGVNWHEFNADHPATGQIGYGDDYGPLRFKGPWLSLKGERLYPWPGNLMHKDVAGEGAQLRRLGIGAVSHCQLGQVHCPALPDDSRGFKPLETAWLRETGLQAVLAGKLPAIEDIIYTQDLFCREPRLGIALEQATRTARESLLYQTRHLRLFDDVAVELDVEGLSDIQLPEILRLGGESRLASLVSVSTPEFLPPGPVEDGRLALYLLTPARFENGWLPDGFTPAEHDDGSLCWKGAINDIPLTIHAAIIGKAHREGGWNQAEGKPRAVTSRVPAGSIYYCHLQGGDASAAVERLHGGQVGADTALGQGQLAVGCWLDEEHWSNE